MNLRLIKRARLSRIAYTMITARILPVFQNQWSTDELFKLIDQEVGKLLSKKAKAVRFEGKKGESLSVFLDTPDLVETELLVVGLGKKEKLKLVEFQDAIAQTLRKIAAMKISQAELLLTDRMGTDAFSLGKLLSEALYLSQYRYDVYKTVDIKDVVKVEDLDILLQPTKNQSKAAFETEYKQLQAGVELGRRICRGVYMARDLVNEPALHLTPKKIADEARKIATASKGMITIDVLDWNQCEKLGMHSFLSVARGSDEKPQFIVLHYKGKPSVKNRKKLCIIGKTILFDSGGLSLKPSKSMETMKMDMAGGAVVLGVFSVLSKLDPIPHEIYGILPATENMPSGKASRPGDIVKALNGKTIEILNTDAEGRLALADALSYAEKYLRPDSIIDLATLTGAVIVALGDDITGMFVNDEKLAASLTKSANNENELLWRMPLHQEYKEHMKSKIADLKNVSGTGHGGAITAAVFLEEFVAKTPWAHLDIAGAAFNEGREKGMTPVGATGWGVKTMIHWLMNA